MNSEHSEKIENFKQQSSKLIKAFNDIKNCNTIEVGFVVLLSPPFFSFYSEFMIFNIRSFIYNNNMIKELDKVEMNSKEELNLVIETYDAVKSVELYPEPDSVMSENNN